MSTYRYTVYYPDGSRGKLKEDQKRQMEREGLLRPVGDGRRFHYAGQSFHFARLGDLRTYKAVITATRFVGTYPGCFIWQHRGRRRKETLESPDQLARRLGLLA